MFDDLIERLKLQAQRASDIARQMAEDKSLRQEGNTERRTDLYMWPTPEQTTEGRAATALTTMQAREATLIRVLERAAENFERMVPYIVGHNVHDFASEAAKQIREALSTSELVERS